MVVLFTMLTGVTKFGKVSVFSDLNNLDDISMWNKLGIYRLGFPNREVEEGFVCFLLPYYASVDKVESPFEIQKFVREVRAGD